jgi:hypothetical protein
MSDFYQSGVVATLHRLDRANGHKIETQLEAFGHQRPCLGASSALADLSRALHGIIQELTSANYPHNPYCGEHPQRSA